MYGIGYAFFIPHQLIDFEYLEPKQLSPAQAKMQSPFLHEMDFAFFAVNFGYSKQDYQELTPKERMFLMKAYENKTVSWSTLVRDACFNAVSNALRKKNKKFVKLWKKRTGKTDVQTVQNNLKVIQNIEKNEQGWIDKIYKANGKKVKKNG